MEMLQLARLNPLLKQAQVILFQINEGSVENVVNVVTLTAIVLLPL